MKTLYFLHCDRFVKIGIADDVQARIAQLQTGNPHAIELLGTLPDVPETLEGVFHNAFLDDHHSGEWFRFSAKLRKVLLLIRHGARPLTPTDLQILREFSPRRGFAANIPGCDPAYGLGGFDKALARRVGLRSRST